MRPRQNADLATDLPNILQTAAIETFALLDDQLSDGLLLNVVKRLFDDALGYEVLAELFGQGFTNLFKQAAHRDFALHFAGVQESGNHLVASELLRLRKNFIGHFA